MSSREITFQLPDDLCRRIEARFIGTRFQTLEALIGFVLEELLRDEAQQLDTLEERIVEQRLRDLGYI